MTESLRLRGNNKSFINLNEQESPSNIPMRWNDEKNIKFILLYKEQSCLWQMDSLSYKDKEQREFALQKVVEEMGIPGFEVPDVKIKIKNLRSHYCQELKKIKDSRLKNPNSTYKPTLIWFELIDEFLRPYVHRSGASTKVSKNKDILHKVFQKMEKSHDDDDNSNEDIDKIEDEYKDEIEQMYQQPAIKRRIINSDYTNNSPYGPTIVDAQGGITEIVNEKETEFDIFGRGIAAQLNNMPLAEALKLQLKIQTLITEERLKQFENPLDF